MNSAGDSKRIKVLHLIPSLSIGGAELDMVRKALVLARNCDFEISILPYQGIVALCRRDYDPLPLSRGNCGAVYGRFQGPHADQGA